MNNPVARVVTDFPYEVVEREHTWIPMPDGVRLSARMWLPANAQTDPVPAILEYIPYRKRDGTRVRDDCRHRYWAGHGYACVRLDIRGTGDSEGLITDEYPQSEQDDAVAAIEWIAAQPWCSGSVGMTGISWGGFNALQVAARRPPALKTIITHCSTDDRYADDVHWMGGCLLSDGFFWGSGFFHYMSKPPDPELVGERWREQWHERLAHWQPPASHIWMRHQRRDDYWRHGSVCEDYSAIECPVYAVGGWEDGYSNAVPRLLARLNVPCKGLIGPWGHKYPEQGIPGPAIGFLQESLRWWDRWLKQTDNGIENEPAYTVWMQDWVAPEACLDHVPGRWVSEQGWPCENITQRTLPLGDRAMGDKVADRPVLAHYSPQTLGTTSGSWCPYGLGGSSPDLAVDQRMDDGMALCFDTGPCGESFELLGAPVASLRIQVDQPQALIAVRLADVAPNGITRRISYGLLNLTHRDDHEHTAAMPVGEWVNIDLQLNDLGHRVAQGHRLRLSVSTTYWPMMWPSPRPVNLSIDTAASSLKLPTRIRTDGASPTFEPAEIAPVGATRVLEPPVSSRTIESDLGSGTLVQRMVEDGGTSHIEAIDLAVSDGMTAEFSIDEDDPLSCDWYWQWHSERRRDDWHVRIETSTRLRASETEFFIDTDIEAWEDDVAVFTRAWRERIPRDDV